MMNTSTLQKYIISRDASVKDAIETMEKNKGGLVCVTDDTGVLLGLLTQGDMRRYILRTTDLSASVCSAMNARPTVFTSREEVERFREASRMIAYPIVDKQYVLREIVFEKLPLPEQEVISDELRDVPLVIMAGGKGTRLYPYTKILPKALIPIGDMTISERIIRQFTRYGCRKVYFILNHKANMIKAYFNDLPRTYDIEYLTETEFLGTGGGLALLKGKVHSPFIVSNCDILIDDDLECVYRTHKRRGDKITMVCAMKNVTIPYGVVSADEHGSVQSMREKPEFSFLTNTGVYVIEPEVIDQLQDNEFIHLPDIAQRYMDAGEKVGVFPVSERAWLDMGQFSEMEQMMKTLDIQ